MRLFQIANPFRFIFGWAAHDDFLARYVVREHANGRPLAEILEDPYVRNRSTPEARRKLLERPEIVDLLGEHALEGLRESIRAAA
jgi:hypothetical protein